MKIYERTPGKWYLRFQLDGKNVNRFVGSTKSEATDALKDFRRKKALASLDLPDIPKKKKLQPIKFKNLAGLYLDHSYTNKAYRTYINELRCFNSEWIPIFGDRNVREIKPLDLQLWREKASDRLNPRTIRNYLQMLKTFFSYAKLMDHFDGDDPVGRLPKIFKSEIRVFTIPEIQLFLASCSKRFFPIASTLIFTGMRPIELINLRKKDVDLERMVITIQPTSSLKNIYGRTIPINSQFLPILEEQMEKHDSTYVFKGVGGGKRSDIKHGLDYALKKSGLPKIRMYDLRHMFASLMLESGRDPMAVAELMGHGGLDLTMRIYHHLHPDRARRVIDSMPQIVTRSQAVPKFKTA